MRKLGAMIGALAALLCAAALLAIPSSAATSEHIKATARLVETNEDGYYWIVRDRHGRRIGYLALQCAAFPHHGVQQCVGTLSLPLGKISFVGSLRNVKVFSLAVMRGTGAYEPHSHGTLLVTKGDPNWTIGVDLR